jgi:hypothetical protein
MHVTAVQLQLNEDRELSQRIAVTAAGPADTFFSIRKDIVKLQASFTVYGIWSRPWALLRSLKISARLSEQLSHFRWLP